MSDLDDAVKRLEERLNREPGWPISIDIRTVLDALSDAQSEIEGINREWRETLDMTREAIQQRDEALAVISELNAALARFPAAVTFRAEATEILGRAPVDALQERDAATIREAADWLNDQMRRGMVDPVKALELHAVFIEKREGE